MKKFKNQLKLFATIVLAVLSASIANFGVIVSQISFFSSLKKWNEKVYFMFGLLLLVISLFCGLLSAMNILVDYQLPKKKMQAISVSYDIRPMFFQIVAFILSIFFFSFILLDRV